MSYTDRDAMLALDAECCIYNGQRALREVIRDPSYQLAGVLVYDAAKADVDAGDLCGETATGIVATNAACNR